jgi:endonuclease-8
VTRFDTAYAHLGRVDVDRPIAGRTVEAVRAAGKHLLVCFSGGLTLRTHLRMNGSWHIYRPGERWQRPARDMRVLVETADFVAVGFNVPEAELLDDAALARHEGLRALGPDLLAEAFDEAEALRRLRARPDAEIANALLDQRAMAGLGNVYKSEILFLCGIDPTTTVGALSDDRLGKIVATAAKLIRANVGESKGAGIVTYGGMRRTTGRANPADRLWVYGRGGDPCRRCRTPIAYRKQGPDARGTYYCPRCQAPARA